MSTLEFLKRLITEDRPPSEVSIVVIPTDSATWERAQKRIEDAKRALGPKFILHPANRIERKT